jgi:2-polyprenyl-6-hydroxyphenyl methylase/3-demethylubiquinone-9 3-methyltransferase
VRAPAPFKGIILGFSLVRLWGPATVRKLLGGGVRSLQPGKQPQPRGMDLWHDAKDWVGGYPFEVAKPERIFDFYRNLGFELQRM